MIKNIFKDNLIKCGLEISKIDFDSQIILVGTLFSKDNKNLMDEILEKQKKIIYCSSMEDGYLHSKNFLHLKYEIGCEIGFLALLMKQLFQENSSISSDAKEYFQELDEGYLSAESSISEEEIEDLVKLIKNSSKCTLLFGEDINNHPNSKEIAEILTTTKYSKDISISLLDNSFSDEKNENIYLPDIDELQSYDGTIVYISPNSSSKDSKQLVGSMQFGLAAKIKDMDSVEIKTGNLTYTREFCLKENLKGTVAILPIEDDTKEYRFQKAKISKRVIDE